MLGWAVYFGHSEQAEEVIKWALAQSNTNPFLPMRAGFFKSKTAKDIAEYYQRKNLILLIEQCEKTRDDSMRSFGEALRKQLETDVPAEAKVVASQTRSKRESPSETVEPMDKKVRGNGTTSPPLLLARREAEKAKPEAPSIEPQKARSASPPVTAVASMSTPRTEHLTETTPQVRSPSPLVEDPNEKVVVEGSENTTQSPPVLSNLSGSVLPAGKRYHVMLSYSWGPHQTTRARARLLTRLLESQGLRVYLTEDHVEDDVQEAINAGVEQSVMVAVCLTKGYSERIATYARNKSIHLEWCVAEFNASFSAIAKASMISVAMDPGMLDWSKWVGDIALALKGREFIDFTTDNDWNGVAQRIAHLVANEIAKGR